MTFDLLTPDDDATLHWRQPDATAWHFLLQAAGGRTLGRLSMDAWSGSKGSAATAGGAWHFRSEGFWRPRMVVQAGDADVATLQMDNPWIGTRAALVAGDGHPIATWVMASVLGGDVSWQDAEGAPLITFRRGTDEGGRSGWWRTQCRVDFTPAGFADPERDLLLCLGWHFSVLAAYPAL
jgi:hypothetical protein